MIRHRPHLRTSLGAVLLTIAGALAGVAPAFAAAELIVTFADAAAGQAATVELTAPDGGSQKASDDDGDGVVLLTAGDTGTA